MSEKNMRDYTQIYIDGTSVVSAGGETIDVINQQRNSPRGRSRVTANAAAFLALPMCTAPTQRMIMKTFAIAAAGTLMLSGAVPRLQSFRPMNSWVFPSLPREADYAAR
jgi:hypothetical protein